MSILTTMLSALRRTIHSDAFFNRSRVNETDFTRNRVLSFAKMITYIIWCAKTSLPSTLRFLLVDKLGGKESCTRQAFSKRRRSIKPEALEELFKLSMQIMVQKIKPEKDRLRILAVDGTKLDLPTHTGLEKTYGIQKSTGNLPQALVSILYDVEHRFVLDVQVRPHNGNEREMAHVHFKKLQTLLGSSDYLIIYDRGYPSGKLLETFSKAPGRYLMRCPKEFLPAIDKNKEDAWITHKFHSNKEAVSIRVIHAKLPNGNEEILCTNLSDEYTASELVDLYAERWSIEINYDFLKNRIQPENLSGITACAFLQHLYACMLMCNLCAAYYNDNRDWEAEAGSVPKLKLRRKKDDETILECNRRINMATVLAAIRSILPRVLAYPHSRLKTYLGSIAVQRLKNVFRYDKDGRNKTRVRIHPALKFTQSQRQGF